MVPKVLRVLVLRVPRVLSVLVLTVLSVLVLRVLAGSWFVFRVGAIEGLQPPVVAIMARLQRASIRWPRPLRSVHAAGHLRCQPSSYRVTPTDTPTRSCRGGCW